MNSPFSLENKNILITGASSGIGRSTAIECSKQGASCILTGRNIEALEETSKKLRPDCKFIIQPCDLTDSSQLETLVENCNLLDGIVVNAGINHQKLIQFSGKKDFDEIFDINCFSPILLIRSLLKKKKLNKNASIVFTSSISGLSNFSIGNATYGASKNALTTFMKYLAVELASKGIRCNAVHPGRIETPLLQKNLLDKETLEKDISKYPLKRYGKPEEVAYAVIYLLSEASAWVTGTSLVIDGGRSLV